MLAKLAVVLATLALVSTAGCVYYNTFYHAEDAAREAELLRQARGPDSEPGQLETELLERIVEKCGRVLKLHPDSQWADDALLLMGKSLYRLGRYESAEARLAEFLTLHPDSELLSEAEYELASVMLARGNPVSAERLLEGAAYATPALKYSDDAMTLIGQAKFARGQYKEASETYHDALGRFGKSDRRAEMRFLLAETFAAMGNLEEAAATYALVQEERGARPLAFEARMRLAAAYLELERGDEALTVLSDLERRSHDRDELDRILLLRGRVHESMGAVDEAVATYESIAASHQRSDAASEAHYRIGLINRDHHEDLDAAVEALRSARDEAPRSDAAKLAGTAISDIEDLRETLAIIEAFEQSLEASEGADPEPAGSEVDRMPADAIVDTAARMTVLPGLADTQGHTAFLPGTRDTAARTEVLPGAADTALSEYGPPLPGGPAADEDAPPAPPSPEDLAAAARFRAAEIYLFRFEDPERAVARYESVILEHPRSDLAPKAALAIAWVLETIINDKEGALAEYGSVVRRYPHTEYAIAAAEGLERLSVDGEDESSR